MTGFRKRPNRAAVFVRRIGMRIFSSGFTGLFSLTRLDMIIARLCEIYLRGYLVRHVRRINSIMRSVE